MGCVSNPGDPNRKGKSVAEIKQCRMKVFFDHEADETTNVAEMLLQHISRFVSTYKLSCVKVSKKCTTAIVGFGACLG